MGQAILTGAQAIWSWLTTTAAGAAVTGAAASAALSEASQSGAMNIETPAPTAQTDEATQSKRDQERKNSLRRGLASTVKNSASNNVSVYKPQLGSLGSGGSGSSVVGTQKKKLLGQ